MTQHVWRTWLGNRRAPGRSIDGALNRLLVQVMAKNLA
jgi:hypothetical protein